MSRNGRLPSITAGIAILICLEQPNIAAAQGCAALKGKDVSQGELYALFERKGKRTIALLNALPFPFPNEFEFNPKIRLIYVLDSPTAGPFTMRRDFSGVLAVRLVSTASHSNGTDATVLLRRPAEVKLQRDRIKRRGSIRRAMSGSASARSYHIYHHPRALRASDSFLERIFHTEYTHREDQPDRKTYEPRDRRTQFAFPEMREEPPPSDAVSKVLAGLFGSGIALAAGHESRFEAQIKYYERMHEPRCVEVTTRLDLDDDGTLKVTITDLDYPFGIDSPWNSESWLITWKKPSITARAR